jgi:serine/threonine-protein kinase
VALAPGESFGRYTIERLLGQGGMGKVLLATDGVLERKVALKVILPERQGREEAIARFFREARLAAQITHPNTVQIYDLGEHEGTPFIAMEFVDGEALTYFCGRPEVTAARKLRWLVGIARGLAAAHRRALIHRDIKPSNVMVSEGDLVKVCDFGLAKRRETTPELRKTFSTQMGFVVGTPAYMAPEQILGLEVDARADQFAWGLTAHALLTGRNPRTNDPTMVRRAPDLSDVVDGVPKRAAEVITRAIELARTDRFATMDDVADELEAALHAPAKSPLAIAQIVDDMPIRESVVPPSSAPLRWRFHRNEKKSPIGLLAAGAIGPSGTHFVGFGAGGAIVFAGGSWRPHPLPPGLDPADVHCVCALADGSVMIGGAGSLVARIKPNGDAERWHPHPERDGPVDFLGMDVAGDRVALAGSRPGGGAIAHVTGDGLDVIETPLPLRAIATLDATRHVACGPNGTVTIYEGRTQVMQKTVCLASLNGIARVGREVYVVGGGGWAISMKTSTFVTEKVETVSSLEVVFASGDEVWAGTDRARILRRDREGVWRRMSPDWGVEPRLLAIWTGRGSVIALAEDGSILHGKKVA